jgi:hypothetical protein
MGLGDDELLARELNEQEDVFENGRWRKRRFYERSAGGNVMLAWACVLWLVMLALTTTALGRMQDLAAVGACILFGIEGLVAIWLSRVLWRLIGPMPRTALRWAARFWFIAIPLLCIVSARIVAPLLAMRERARRVAAGATAEQASAGVVGATQGVNWRMVLGGTQGYRRVSREEARHACAALGTDFRLPRINDLATLTPTPHAPDALLFWLEEQGPTPFFTLRSHERGPAHPSAATLNSGTKDTVTAAVFCVNPTAR